MMNHVLIILFTSILLYSCAPVFSELQSARTVGKNKIEFTPSLSSVHFSKNLDSEGVQNHIGIQTAYGITQKLDIRARYERFWLKEGDRQDGLSVVGIGPKVSLVENKIAFFIPIGKSFSEDILDTWGIHPTLLFTLPALRDKIDLTLSPKYLWTFCDHCDDFIAVNLGVSLSTDLNKWAIRPEYGLLFNPGESGYFGQFSLGFSTVFSK